MRWLIGFVAVWLSGLNVVSAALPVDGRIVFPKDVCVLNVKADCGARGDGKTDDTAALQKALDESCGPKSKRSAVVYLPNGTYRLTGTLVVNKGNNGAGIGPWIYGETRDGVILRLDDGVKNSNAVLRTHPNDEGGSSANWFMRNIRNLTIDVGNNPETDGIRYVATNSGLLQNVRLIGKGKVGINAGFLGESGPNMIQDVEIVGYETGIRSAWMYGQTLSRISIKDCRKVGVYVVANVMAIEDLKVQNTPQALHVDYPNDWTWWSGVVALVGGDFSHAGSREPAIHNRGTFMARDVKAEGFRRVLESSTPAGNVDGKTLDEYLSHAPLKLFDRCVDKTLRLPIEREPVVPWETDPRKWLCVDDYGAIPGDNQDDTMAIQRALDAAARLGKTTVYFRGVGGADPNWYTLNGEVYIRGGVRHVLGLGFGRILGGKFVVNDRSGAYVKFENLDSFGGTPPELINRSSERTMLVESCGVTVVGEGKGKIFLTNTPAHVRLEKPGQPLWARGLNPEGIREGGLVQNHGGRLWVLGSKTEGKGIRYITTRGGESEFYGCYEYTTEQVADDDIRAMFTVDNARVSVAALREVCFHGKPYVIKMQEKRLGDIRKHKRGESGGDWAFFGAALPR